MILLIYSYCLGNQVLASDLNSIQGAPWLQLKLNTIMGTCPCLALDTHSGTSLLDPSLGAVLLPTSAQCCPRGPMNHGTPWPPVTHCPFSCIMVQQATSEWKKQHSDISLCNQQREQANQQALI